MRIPDILVEVRGGVVDVTATIQRLDILIIDYDNIKAGDVLDTTCFTLPPILPQEMIAIIRKIELEHLI